MHPLRCPPGTRFFRRPRTDRSAILHEFGVAEIRRSKERARGKRREDVPVQKGKKGTRGKRQRGRHGTQRLAVSADDMGLVGQATCCSGIHENSEASPETCRNSHEFRYGLKPTTQRPLPEKWALSLKNRRQIA